MQIAICRLGIPNICVQVRVLSVRIAWCSDRIVGHLEYVRVIPNISVCIFKFKQLIFRIKNPVLYEPRAMPISHKIWVMMAH